MAARSLRIAPQPGEIPAAEELVRLLRQSRLPPWVFPPAKRIDLSARGSIPAPANNVLTQVVQYQVPDGFRAVITQVVLFFQGGGFVPGSQNVLFTIDVNTPITGGVPAGGRPVSSYGAIDTNLGSPTFPFHIPSHLDFTPQDTIRIKVITQAPVAVAAPNYVIGQLWGWLYPVYNQGEW